MRKSALLTNTVAALVLCAAPAAAQMKERAPDEKAAPSQPQREPAQRERAPQASNGAQKAEPREKGASPGPSREQPTRGTAQSEPRDKAAKQPQEKTGEPKEKSTKGPAEKGAEPNDNARKGTAGKNTEPQDRATKGTAEKGLEPKDKAAGAAPQEKSAARVQVSEQQRTNVHQTLLKDRNVNRVRNVNFSINVGTRVPRSLRLVALPVAVIDIVPEYRNYRYFVYNDEICIVDPNSYEIVEVITVSRQSAGSLPRLVLSDEERMIILREVDLQDGSTLALGALSEGADVPRGVELRLFPETVVRQLPKVKGYKFFTAENRLAIVDARGAKVQLVIEGNR